MRRADRLSHSPFLLTLEFQADQTVQEPGRNQWLNVLNAESANRCQAFEEPTKANTPRVRSSLL